ncbi:DUF421 domain-containing protein [Paenibacillus mesotrionivorans]|jgi:uncharacterized membrane protein YcaP (DUF421 family)|uniref:DUF421 domain-containing protein n=1 Tax=Paenibacillus mesotrionivorans TaxID=3160968 RepID=A0ACC7NXX4_9BACL
MLGWGQITIRAVGALIMLFVLTRILGKKQISQLTFFEYITGIVIGDLAGFLSTDVEADYMHGVIAMIVWFSIPLLAELLAMKSKVVRNLLEGKGTVFIKSGKVLERNLRKERYTTDELLEQLRTKSVFNPADVEFAILEASGDLSVMLKEENQPLTPKDIGQHPKRIRPPQAVIMDGTVQDEGLNALGFNRQWLEQRLQQSGTKVDDVFLAVADENGGMYTDFYKDNFKPPVKRRKWRGRN